MSHTNRLIDATSPYLLQHARNPVDWYPWGEEALERARREDKPILLSIGYAACHWCHVMEHESFENEEVARIMNERFINIKVDREERPDLDDIYMMAVQQMTGSGGWPMSVFLTPDLKPFYAGTYFPPEDRWGRPGFKSLLLQLDQAWRERRGDVEQVAERAAQAIRQYASLQTEAQALEPGLISRAVDQIVSRFDSTHGGFGSAPKFPPSMSLALILREMERLPEGARRDHLRRVVTLTLDRMARGGIYDQVGGGFHRYSTDTYWLVPHFEKMLYDNALLVPVYLEAHRLTGDPFYARIVHETLAWTLREMTHPEGGFYSTLDADSEGEEGKFYVWTPAEVEAALGREGAEGTIRPGRWTALNPSATSKTRPGVPAAPPRALTGEGVRPSASGPDSFNRIYDITPEGNWEGKSIPRLLRPVAEWARELGEDPEALQARLDEMRERLLAAREERVRPGLDDKILTSWNGLMIGAMARAGAALGDARYHDAAVRAAEFVLTHLQEGGRLRRAWREGRAPLAGFQDDYAFLIVGLLDLHAASGEARWLEEARRLTGVMNDLFWDDAEGGYFFTARDHESLIARLKSPEDGAIPSGNSMAAVALVRLADLTGEAEYRRRAENLLTTHAAVMERAAAAFPQMLIAADMLLQGAEGGERAGRVVAEVVLARDAAIRPGEDFEATVRLVIPPGWHVNAHRPGPDYLIPTVVQIATPPGFAFREARYPDGRATSTDGADEPICVYEGEVTIALRLAALPELATGDYSLRVGISYQPCTERECLPPVEEWLTLPVRV